MDESLVEVFHGFLVVRVHRDGVDGGEKLGRYRHRALLRTSPVREILIEADLKRVDGKLKLSLYLVHKFQLDASLPRLVPEGEQGPLDLGRHNEHHLSHVRLFQEVPADSSLR